MKTWLTAIGIVAAVAVAGVMPTTASAACGSKGVAVYDANWCPYCKKVRALLSRHNIKYTVIDASRARAYMARNFGTTSIPVTVIDGSYVLGFNEARIRQLLCI